MKKIIFILIFLSSLILNQVSYASNLGIWEEIIDENKNNIEYEINLDQEIRKSYRSEISINTELKIDLTDLIDKLKILNPENDFIVKWELTWAKLQKNWPVFSRVFSDKWEKEIILSLYQKSNNWTNKEPQLVLNRKINILVFEKSLPIVFSNESNKNEIQNYVDYAKKDWIFIYQIWPFNDKSEIELSNILVEIEKYEKWIEIRDCF